MAIEKTLIHEGILDSIPEINQTFDKKNNGRRGPGGSSWNEHSGYCSTLQIKIDSELKEIKYNGIILPDSIGNKIEVYSFETIPEGPFVSPNAPKIERIKIYDPKLNRWYN